jgi:ferredoxin
MDGVQAFPRACAAVQGEAMNTAYRDLARRLDELANGFPSTADGAELRLLAKLFTAEEAAVASQLSADLRPLSVLASQLGRDANSLGMQLKEMTRRGLIRAGRVDHRLGYGLLPFIVGIYEMQLPRIDEELALLFEDYYRQAAPQLFAVAPQFHRVIPVHQAVPVSMEVHPFESIACIIDSCKSWGVIDCICRVERRLAGQPCEHPIDVCMTLSPMEHAFDGSNTVKALTRDEAMATLDRAAEAGLVHSVSNTRDGVWYICNCCTCGCGILRGMAELGLANVVARSAYACRADADMCISCGACSEACQFGALSLPPLLAVDSVRCVGCGVCVHSCRTGALALFRRPESEIAPPPVSEADWRRERAAARGLHPASAV